MKLNKKLIASTCVAAMTLSMSAMACSLCVDNGATPDEVVVNTMASPVSGFVDLEALGLTVEDLMATPFNNTASVTITEEMLFDLASGEEITGFEDQFLLVELHDDSMPVRFNGCNMNWTDVKPMARENTTFVPIRDFAENLGAVVGYNSETNAVTIEMADDVISFIIGSADVDVNGTTVTLPTATFATENRTMVPLRLISEVFGMSVYWNQYTNDVDIYDWATLTENLTTDYTAVDDLLAWAWSNDENLVLSGSFSAGAFSMDLELDLEKELSDTTAMFEGNVPAEAEAILTELMAMESLTVASLFDFYVSACDAYNVADAYELLTVYLPVVADTAFVDGTLEVTVGDTAVAFTIYGGDEVTGYALVITSPTLNVSMIQNEAVLFALDATSYVEGEVAYSLTLGA